MKPVDGRWPEGIDEARRLAEDAAAQPGYERAPGVGARVQVWRGVEARLGRRRRRRLAAPFAVGIAAAAAVLLIVRVHQIRQSTPSLPAWSTTTAERVDLHGAARVVIGEQTRARLVEDDAAGMVVSLARGTLLADVAHRPAGAPFVVETPTARVRVVGTVLWVAVADDGATTVEVARGAVEVTPHGGAPAVVHAGERWPAGTTRTPAALDVTLLDSPDAAGFAERPSPAPARAPMKIALPTNVVPPPQPSGLCPGLAGAAAVACLERVASSKSALRAEAALYELGWRRLHDLGDPAAALATWERQRTRFPSGALREEADLSILEALMRLGDTDRARRESDAFLVAHPDSLAAAEVHFIRGMLARADGDCARARAELGAALAAPPEPWADTARRALAECQSPTGE